jgi:5-methylcytosine-specific restriction endonuclease McrA
MRRRLLGSARLQILRAQGNKCAYCFRAIGAGEVFHIDHIIPFSKGGATNFKNSAASCVSCNLKKGSRYEQEVT